MTEKTKSQTKGNKYKKGNYIVEVCFAKTGPTVTECIESLVRRHGKDIYNNEENTDSV